MYTASEILQSGVPCAGLLLGLRLEIPVLDPARSPVRGTEDLLVLPLDELEVFVGVAEVLENQAEGALPRELVLAFRGLVRLGRDLKEELEELADHLVGVREVPARRLVELVAERLEDDEQPLQDIIALLVVELENRARLDLEERRCMV